MRLEVISCWCTSPRRTWSSGEAHSYGWGLSERGGCGHLGANFNLLPITALDQPPYTVTSLIISHFLYIKKTTKSWHIISNPVHPIMIQWIIYFPKLNHLGSHFLPCRQKPLFFTHGFQLVFIEAFKIYLNTERFKKSCFIFLSQLLSQYHFVLVFLNFSVSKAEKQHISLLRLCNNRVTGQEGVGFYLEVDISFEYIYNLSSFIAIFMFIYTHVCHISARWDFSE